MPYGNTDIMTTVVSIYHETIHGQIMTPTGISVYESVLTWYQEADDVEVRQEIP